MDIARPTTPTAERHPIPGPPGRPAGPLPVAGFTVRVAGRRDAGRASWQEAARVGWRSALARLAYLWTGPGAHAGTARGTDAGTGLTHAGARRRPAPRATRAARSWARGAVAVGTLALAAGVGQAAAGQPWLASASYTIVPGDSLWSIAQRFGTTVSALASANGISDPSFVEAGTTLVIPSGAGGAAGAGQSPGGMPGSYTVPAGDSMWSIAEQFGTTVSALASLNGITDPSFVEAGTTLVVPGGTGEPAGSTLTGAVSAPGRSGTLPAGLWAHSDRMALFPVFRQAAATAGVPLKLLEGLTWQESGWQPEVVSAAGAVGIGQLLPDTTDFVNNQLLGASLDPTVASQNITMTATFLRYLLDQTGWNVPLAVAAYYQGLRSVTTEGLLPETQQYVADVLAQSALF